MSEDWMKIADKEAFYAKVEYIKRHVPIQSQFEQLAEECCELAQAALKYNRAFGNGNPTPVKTTDALYDLLSEARDVYACMLVCYVLPECDKGIQVCIERWYDRLKEAENDNG